MKTTLFLSALFVCSVCNPLGTLAETDIAVPDANLTYEGYSKNKALKEAARAKPIEPLAPTKGTLKAGDQRLGNGKVHGIEKGVRPVKPRAYGSAKIPFSAKRVRNLGQGQVINAINSNHPGWLSAQWPYSPFGKLTFKKQDNRSYMCSAQLIRKSVIVTAAHCLGGYGSKAFYKDWVFIPAYYNYGGKSSAPYGSWRAQTAVLPGVWYRGNDPQGSKANDLAVIILRKDKNKFVGERTGYLGYATFPYSFTNSPYTKYNVGSVTAIGYPGSMDSGGVMQISTGPAFQVAYGKAPQYVIGGYFNGGSSGGGWVVNFGSTGSGVPDFGSGTNAGSAASQAVIGLTSWGDNRSNTTKRIFSPRFGKNRSYTRNSYMTPTSRVPGAGNLGSILNYACGLKPSGSSRTYWQLGYCS